MAVEIETSHEDYESLILVWLEEILYKLEIDNRFYVDGQYMIRENKPKLICEVQVSYIDANLVDRNLEIKAVTSHESLIKELNQGETFFLVQYTSRISWTCVGWKCILIFSGNSKDGRSFNMAKSTHFLHPATHSTHGPE